MPAHLLKLLATPIFSNTSLRPRSGHPVASIAADDLEAEERHRRESQHVFHRVHWPPREAQQVLVVARRRGEQRGADEHSGARAEQRVQMRARRFSPLPSDETVEARIERLDQGKAHEACDARIEVARVARGGDPAGNRSRRASQAARAAACPRWEWCLQWAFLQIGRSRATGFEPSRQRST